MNNLAPIVLFVYNRPTHTRKCLESLTKNDLSDESELFIYADGYKDGICGDQLHEIKKVRSIIKEKQWCRKVHIIERKTNIGLANSIIQGVTEIVNLYGKIIVLEDDFFGDEKDVVIGVVGCVLQGPCKEVHLIVFAFLKLGHQNICVIDGAKTDDNRNSKNNPLEVGIVLIEVHAGQTNRFIHEPMKVQKKLPERLEATPVMMVLLP